MTIKALDRGYRVIEVPVNLTSRLEGSFSKIHIVNDGMRILNMLLSLFRDYKPLTFFGAVGLLLIALGLIPGTIVIVEFFETGLVPRLPSAVLAVGLFLSGMMSMTVGLILHTVVRRSQEFEHQLRAITDELRRQVQSEIGRSHENDWKRAADTKA